MFSVIHTDGSGNDDPPVESLSSLHDELSTADQEHGDVSVVHEDTGWCMSAHRDGRLIFQHLGTREGRHMIPVSKERVLALWHRLINGDVEGILTEPWKSGYSERADHLQGQ
jgi:hypothetical protein